MKKLYIILSILLIPYIAGTTGKNVNTKADNPVTATEEVVVDFWENLKIYPNPSVKYLYIENAKGAVLDVFNVSGKKVFSRQLTRPRFVLDVESWKQGAYFFRFRGEQGVKTEKVIVK